MSEETQRQNVLLEEIRSQVAALVEGHGVLVEGQSGLRQGQDELRQRLDRVETKVDTIAGDVSVLKSDIADVKVRAVRIEHHVGLNGSGSSPKKSTRKRTRKQ